MGMGMGKSMSMSKSKSKSMGWCRLFCSVGSLVFVEDGLDLFLNRWFCLIDLCLSRMCVCFFRTSSMSTIVVCSRNVGWLTRMF